MEVFRNDVWQSRKNWNFGHFLCQCVPPLARAASNPQARQPQKDTGWGSARVTCKFGIGGAPRLTCRTRDPDKFVQACTRRHVPRAMCVVHPWKVHNHVSAGCLYPPWKFGASASNRFHARLQKPRRTDRQTDKKCQLFPSIIIRNTKNLQMLKHMNLLSSSSDFVLCHSIPPRGVRKY